MDISKSDPSRVSHTKAGSATPLSLTDEEKQAVTDELQRVLDSTEFRSSPRCQEFLRYVVGQTLRGETEILKERNIGIDVFHRRPTYEPNNDAIVRVRATEVRKRLSHYYEQPGTGATVRMVVAPGSYVPEFHWRSDEVAPVVAPAIEPQPPTVPEHYQLPRTWPRWLLASVGVLAFAAAVLLYARTHSAPTPLREFWNPTLQAVNPVVICLGQPVVYHLSRRVHERYRATLPADHPPGPYVIPLRPGEIEASDVLPVPDQYVGAGSALAAARISALLAGWHKASQIRVGNEFSFYDLRNSPAVLEGAFSNGWTMKLTQRMPLVFVQENGIRGIRDRTSPGKVWPLRALQSDGKTSEDYALLGRVFDSGTLEPLVFLAGITQYGTQAAGEFLTNEEGFASAMASAPADWRTRNLQILIHLTVIGQVPGKPEVLAVRTW